MRTLLRNALSGLTCLVLTLSGFIFQPLVAQADTISVSPPKFELFGNPGDTINEKLKITNESATTATYQATAADFTAAGDQGGIDINSDPNSPTTNYSLRKWITVEPSKFLVEAGESRTINLAVKIPKTAEPGGHYATIQVNAAGTGSVSGGGASVQTLLNSLLLLRVSGNVKEQLALNSFSTNKNYYQQAPVTFDLKVDNKGNVHGAPTGTIVITDMFNRKVEEITATTATALPGSSRLTSTDWNHSRLIGRYTATFVGTYGQTNKQTVTASTSFIVFPLTLLWIALGAIALILFLVTQRKGVKRFINRLTTD